VRDDSLVETAQGQAGWHQNGVIEKGMSTNQQSARAGGMASTYRTNLSQIAKQKPR
jgi:hypothetical protein